MKGFHMLNVEGIDSAELEFDSNHAHVEVDSLEFASLVVEFRSLKDFENIFELFVGELHVLTGLVGLFLGTVAAGDVVEEAKLEVKILFRSPLADGALWGPVNLVSSIHL